MEHKEIKIEKKEKRNVYRTIFLIISIIFIIGDIIFIILISFEFPFFIEQVESIQNRYNIPYNMAYWLYFFSVQISILILITLFGIIVVKLDDD